MAGCDFRSLRLRYQRGTQAPRRRVTTNRLRPGTNGMGVAERPFVVSAVAHDLHT